MSEGLFQAREEATKDYRAGPELPYVELLNLFSIEAFRILTLMLYCLFLPVSCVRHHRMADTTAELALIFRSASK